MPSPRPARPDLGVLFVMTYGRSGSTLLMGVLNTLPGYLARGENRDALHHLFLFHRTMLAESERWPRSGRPDHPWFGVAGYPARQSVLGIRRLALDTVLRPRKDTRVTGFKEIRWYHPDLEEYVAWLREVFPGARFLVNTRNHEDVLRSRWWSKGEDKSEHLADIERTSTSPTRPCCAGCSTGSARSSTRSRCGRRCRSGTRSSSTAGD